ncbi:hypothetical protein [Paracoccus sp. IB05]|uniref:hypothetical protein n=1 Tax=Paracoccus sp. IB05 TaxID=2779367 RepID=UPI0018E8A61A|nr:hypothetical protein [Paracoccus sp. IB05]MBJ2154092.1 hypothetical protein [Paracoccus sp. IB05]
MARARKHIAGKRHQSGATSPAADASPVDLPAPAPQTMLVLRDLPEQHRDQILALVRALARDAAREDHAAERGGDAP